MEKAINSATQLLNDRVKEATDIAVIKVNQCAQSLNKKMRETEEALDEVKHEIRYESGFRRFMFWLSPVLAVAQTVLLIMMAL